MQRPLAAVPARFVHTLLDSTRLDPAARERVLRASGIVSAHLAMPAVRISREQFATMYRLLVIELHDEMPGLFARPLRPGTMRLLCTGLLDARTIGAALRRYIRFHGIVLDDFSFALERGPDVARLLLKTHPGYAAPTALAQQLLFKFLHSLLSWLAGHTAPVVRLQFAFPPPPHFYEHMYLYPGPVYFGQAVSAICFPAHFLDVPLVRRSKEDVREFVRRAPAGWLFAPTTEPSVSRRVRDYLERHAAGPSDIESAAQALNYSVRTLCRRLETEGTSFRAIKDELRRDLAVERLTKTRQPIAAIAYELGFEDATAFYRAFKHWTGRTPGAYRRSAGECLPPPRAAEPAAAREGAGRG